MATKGTDAMEPHFVTAEAVPDWVTRLPDGDVFAVIAKGRSRDLTLLPPAFSEPIDLRSRRAVSSPRSILFPLREVVARYPSATAMPEPDRHITILGVRACDLRALQVLDRVLLDGDFRDPFYGARRERTLLVSVDCVEAAEECFCTLVGGTPHPNGQEPPLYDINLSPVEGGFIVDIGSEKGKEAAVITQDVLQEAAAEKLAERDANRQRMKEAVDAQNTEFRTERSMSELAQGAAESDLLLESASACTECGACTLVCPTCHCFLLYDQFISDDQAGRVRSFDSCFFASYARMAGVGAMKPSPRPDLRSRFLNRLLHKFVWLPETTGLLGCVGCGRCIEADMGGLDVRRFVKQLED